MSTRRVLIAPLDWGLGHATRCIPIINEFLLQGCEVLVASSGGARSLLRNEFPTLRHFELPAYSPIYSASSSLVWKLAEQFFKFIKTINLEHKQIEQLVAGENIDLVISDNRYGCWSHNAKSIFITHQINILLPPEVGWMESIVNYLNRYQIKNFNTCWIPDRESENNFTGRLSKTDKLPVKYIGTLTRFVKERNYREKTIDILVILSGPEPQRSMLEKILLQKLQNTDKSVCMVRGVSGDSTTITGNISIVDFVHSTKLQLLIEQSTLIIARSGYSTIMDLEVTGGNVVFIPTPGQTEQEYLANRLKRRGVAYCIKQDEFDINTALSEVKNYSGFEPKAESQNSLQQTIKDIIILEK